MTKMALIAAGLLLAVNVAGEPPKDKSRIDRIGTNVSVRDETQIEIFCIDGYKYMVTRIHSSARVLESLQMYEERDGKTIPATCK